MKVRALQVGFYDNVRRRVGDVFVITSESAFSPRWMVRVPETTPERVTGSQEALNRSCADLTPVHAVTHVVPDDDGEPLHLHEFDPYANDSND